MRGGDGIQAVKGEQVKCDVQLGCIGRRPYTKNLGLEVTGRVLVPPMCKYHLWGGDGGRTGTPGLQLCSFCHLHTPSALDNMYCHSLIPRRLVTSDLGMRLVLSLRRYFLLFYLPISYPFLLPPSFCLSSSLPPSPCSPS